MRRVKRTLFMVASLIMIVALVAGCGQTGTTQNSSTPTPAASADSSASASPSTSPSTAPDDGKPTDVVTVRVLDCWNGSSRDAAADPDNNIVAQKILQATNVKFVIDYATTKESEKLNMLFAAGDIQYDLILAPYWGGNGDETAAIKKAGADGLLKPLEGLLDQYGPNIKPALTTELRQSFIDNDLKYSGYNGHTYVIPTETHATDADYENKGLALYARKDIMDALGWKQSDFNSSDKIYEYLKLVKAGGFTDTTGKPVIPAGTWQNGWEVQQFAKSYKDNSANGFYTYEGKTYAFMRGPLFEQQAMFIWKLTNEGLMDKECFSQSDIIAKEKMAVGKYAIAPGEYATFKSNLGPTLYKTNPEMQYVPIGPIPRQDGTVGESRIIQRGGTQCWFIPASTGDDVAKATIYALNWLNSDEGTVTAFYGEEGKTFDYVDGKPRMKDEYIQKFNDGTLISETGIQGVYKHMISLWPYMSKFGEFYPGQSKSLDENYTLVTTVINPFVKLGEGVDPWTITRNQFKAEDPTTEAKIEEVWFNTLWPDCDDKYRERAYLTDTEAEAMAILKDFEQRMLDCGVEKLEEYVTAHQKEFNIIF